MGKEACGGRRSTKQRLSAEGARDCRRHFLQGGSGDDNRPFGTRSSSIFHCSSKGLSVVLLKRSIAGAVLSYRDGSRQRSLSPSTDVHGELDRTPGIREQPRPGADLARLRATYNFAAEGW